MYKMCLFLLCRAVFCVLSFQLFRILVSVPIFWDGGAVVERFPLFLSFFSRLFPVITSAALIMIRSSPVGALHESHSRISSLRAIYNPVVLANTKSSKTTWMAPSTLCYVLFILLLLLLLH